MKNYFVILEFLNTLTTIKSERIDQESLTENESMVPHITSLKNLNMDIDGIQKQIQEFENSLNVIDGSSLSTDTKKRRSGPETISISCFGSNCQASSQNQELRERIETLEQTCAKLDIDLKREKEISHVKYYRNDQKQQKIK